MPRGKKKRLDEILFERGHAESLADAERLIRAGKVRVGEHRTDKPGHRYEQDAAVHVTPAPRYVSRGGIKLAAALREFEIDPTAWNCADIGASTGGFTDCLLQHGARHVYAVDVGYGQLHWKLRIDPRVTVLERLNVRNLSPAHIPEPLDLAVFDTSFISLSKVIPPVLPFFGSHIRIVALVKPQFEVARNRVDRGGIVRNEAARLEAVAMIRSCGERHGLACKGYIESEISGAKGNREYLIYFVRQ